MKIRILLQSFEADLNEDDEATVEDVPGGQANITTQGDGSFVLYLFAKKGKQRDR